MSAKVFLDTNILIYLLEGQPPGTVSSEADQEANRKADIATLLLENNDIVISVQVLNEICNVVLRCKFDWDKAGQFLGILEALCVAVEPVTLALHKKGLALRDRYQLQLYDSMLLAAALAADCAVFYSEDMQDGQVIEGVLTIRNPFGLA